MKTHWWCSIRDFRFYLFLYAKPGKKATKLMFWTSHSFCGENMEEMNIANLH